MLSMSRFVSMLHELLGQAHEKFSMDNLLIFDGYTAETKELSLYFS